MNNYCCPFCLHLLEKSIIQSWKIHGQCIDELNYSCEFIECKKTSPRETSRWCFQVWENRNINYYRANLPYADKDYILQGSSNVWTRLYYDIPDSGAMTRKPIIELPYIPLQEPLLEFLKTNLRKAVTYIIFT